MTGKENTKNEVIESKYNLPKFRNKNVNMIFRLSIYQMIEQDNLH